MEKLKELQEALATLKKKGIRKIQVNIVLNDVNLIVEEIAEEIKNLKQ